jgi:cytoskeleton protein RodZ
VTTESVVEAIDSAVTAGRSLAQARSALGLQIDEAAARLHVPAHVVTALEQGQWHKLGAPVFVRGQLRSYARLLSLDPLPLVEQVQVEQQAPVALVSHARTPRLRRLADGMGRKALYAGITAALVVPALFALRSQLVPATAVASLDEVPAAESVLAVPVPPAVDGVQPASRVTTPLVASITALPRTAAPAAAVEAGAGTAGQLLLQFSGDSWVDIAGPQGQVVEKGLVPAGQERRYAADAIARVTLGNASQVQASIDGRSLELAPLRRANVARFTVSSDGSVSPVSN